MSGPAASVGTRPNADAPALDVRDLTVHYGDVLALDDVSLTLRRGTSRQDLATAVIERATCNPQCASQ